MKTKIAIHNAQISHYTGGTERLIFEQIKNLLNYPDFFINLVTTKTNYKSEIYEEILNIRHNNFRVYEIADLDKIKELSSYTSNNSNKWHFESIEFGKSAYNFYLKNKFDLVITHFSTDSIFIPQSQKNILHLHGYPLESSEIGEISLRRPDYFIAVSKFVKSKWLELYPQLNKRKIFVAYPGINTSKFIKPESNRSIDIVFVGRLIKIKGIDYLIKAIKQTKIVKSVFIIGRGPEKINLLKLISSLGLKGIVKIKSNVVDEELVEICNNSKLAVFPSYSKEGVILAMLECAASGCAIITTKDSSMEEFINDKKNGLLVYPKNVKDLSSKIKKILYNSNLRDRLSENSKNRVLNKWDSKNRVYELYKTYLKIAHHK